MKLRILYKSGGKMGRRSDRLSEFMGVMERIDIFDSSIFDEQYVTDIDDHCDRLNALQVKYRSSCSAWSWIDWS